MTFSGWTESTKAVLPIELLSFGGRQAGAAIQLYWETATERNNDYVEVQRSRDGKRFEALGRVLGAGNSATPLRYTFSDVQPLPGVNYYRLRQVDFDGKEEYHRVIAVLFRDGKSEGTVQVFPTLAQDQITLALPRELQSPAEVLVSDLNGRVLLRHTLGVGTQQHTLPVAQLASGHYILRIRTDREEQIARFVKE
ncbi:MAG TPA: T9SS type A sorting domain-containing protein [Saprospiraceae bacterium]|nr:T9SS type A sorting domain-containing protein [Saprospiraceae bacterium]